jgi:hypothetical protein
MKNYPDFERQAVRLHMQDCKHFRVVDWQARADLIVFVGCVLAVMLAYWLAK